MRLKLANARSNSTLLGFPFSDRCPHNMSQHYHTTCRNPTTQHVATLQAHQSLLSCGLLFEQANDLDEFVALYETESMQTYWQQPQAAEVIAVLARCAVFRECIRSKKRSVPTPRMPLGYPSCLTLPLSITKQHYRHACTRITTSWSSRSRRA
jgi:hypothetical protein